VERGREGKGGEKTCYPQALVVLALSRSLARLELFVFVLPLLQGGAVTLQKSDLR